MWSSGHEGCLFVNGDGRVRRCLSADCKFHHCVAYFSESGHYVGRLVGVGRSGGDSCDLCWQALECVCSGVCVFGKRWGAL